MADTIVGKTTLIVGAVRITAILLSTLSRGNIETKNSEKKEITEKVEEAIENIKIKTVSISEKIKTTAAKTITIDLKRTKAKEVIIITTKEETIKTIIKIDKKIEVIEEKEEEITTKTKKEVINCYLINLIKLRSIKKRCKHNKMT